MQIERRVDFHGLIGGRRQARILTVERLLDEIDEVRRLGFERALHDDERLERGALGGLTGDIAGVHHRLQHDVAPILAAVRIVERRERRRRLKHAGNRGRFGKRHVADVLAEEQARRFRDTDDAERPALTERHVVQIHLEDRVLRGARGEDQRHPRLDQLAPQRFLPRLLQRHARENAWQENVARHLLRDRARAGQVRAFAADVAEEGADDADRIDARMIVEAAILNREHGLLQPIGNHGQRHGPALLALAAERCQQRRVEREPFARTIGELELEHAVGGRGGGALRDAVRTLGVVGRWNTTRTT